MTTHNVRQTRVVRSNNRPTSVSLETVYVEASTKMGGLRVNQELPIGGTLPHRCERNFWRRRAQNYGHAEGAIAR